MLMVPHKQRKVQWQLNNNVQNNCPLIYQMSLFNGNYTVSKRPHVKKLWVSYSKLTCPCFFNELVYCTQVGSNIQSLILDINKTNASNTKSNVGIVGIMKLKFKNLSCRCFLKDELRKILKL